jgi:cation transport regulator
MPYSSIKDLPDSVRNVLPVHGQEIYVSSFNNAHKQYHSKKNRRNPSEDLDAVCHKVAWTAVKKKYRKNTDGNWIEKK